MRLQDVLQKRKIIHCAQIGFDEKNMEPQTISLHSNHVSSVNRGRVHECFVKAYDSVWHGRLFTKLSALNVNGSFLNMIKDMYSKSSCVVKVSEKRTDLF